MVLLRYDSGTMNALALEKSNALTLLSLIEMIDTLLKSQKTAENELPLEEL